MTPGLWMAATPIGNLGDASNRLKDSLQTAEIILCEDTRKVQSLLAGLNLTSQAKRVCIREFSDQKIENFLKKNPQALMLFISDAGTPSVSDPGANWVRVARKLGIEVSCLPGPCAVSSFWSMAGWEDSCFFFRGFFPRKKKDQTHELDQWKGRSEVWIWYESPKRILKTIEIIEKHSPNSRWILAKELSKIYEQVHEGTPTELKQRFEDPSFQKGEWILSGKNEQPLVSSEEVVSEAWIRLLSEAGVPLPKIRYFLNKNTNLSHEQKEKILEFSKKKSQAT